MKTLILFATKYGATEEIAERIASRIGGATVCNLKSSSIQSVSQFDCVIIGSPVYAGSIRKEAKAFLYQNAGVLRDKRLGLFLSGMAAHMEKKAFEVNFSPDILQAAAVKSHLGGVFDSTKADMLERFIMKVVARKSGYINTISDEKIEQFAEIMKMG